MSLVAMDWSKFVPELWYIRYVCDCHSSSNIEMTPIWGSLFCSKCNKGMKIVGAAPKGRLAIWDERVSLRDLTES